MGRPSKAELREREAHFLKLITESSDTVREYSHFVIEDGPWVAMVLNIFFATGRVCPQNKILWAQRDAVVKTLEFLANEKWTLIDTPIIPDLEVPNPIAGFTFMLRPFANILKQRHPDEPPDEPPSPEELAEWGIPDLPFSPGGGWGALKETLEKLSDIEKDKVGFKPGCYKSIPLQWRVFLALVIPGCLRYTINLIGGMGSLAKTLI